jgi:uncharacterized membrane protein YphA (DoxX/SURF4 family)
MNTKVLCNKALFVLRILLGLAMLYFWATKIGAPEMKIAFIGGAGAKMGLDFLSVTAWYWIAVIGEILAGLLLLAGGKFGKIGALLTLIIMVFVGNTIGWDVSNVKFVLTTFASLVILFYGNGSWDNSTWIGGIDTSDLSSKIGGGLGWLGAIVGAGAMIDSIKDKVGDVNLDNISSLKDKMGNLGDMANLDTLKDKMGDLWNIANLDTLKDKAGDMLGGASTMFDGVKGHMDTLADKAGDYADQAKDFIAKADMVLPDSVSDKLNNVVDFVSDKADQAKVMVTNVTDKVKDGVEVIS